jgi:hypothetical protein
LKLNYDLRVVIRHDPSTVRFDRYLPQVKNSAGCIVRLVVAPDSQEAQMRGHFFNKTRSIPSDLSGDWEKKGLKIW